MSDGKQINDPIKKSVLFASEYVVPGGSNLVKGDLKQAGLHAALGFVAKAFFGLPGLLLISANSYTKAVTGRSLLDQGCPANEADTNTETTEGAGSTRPRRKKEA